MRIWEWGYGNEDMGMRTHVPWGCAFSQGPLYFPSFISGTVWYVYSINSRPLTNCNCVSRVKSLINNSDIIYNDKMVL